jgi:4-diphosphocytidyl-2-C-methyl-D-erythritol kinase
MSRVQVQAPAKLNLGLAIRGMRDDGFHSIESVFSTITLCDQITVELSGDPGGTELTCSGVQSPEGEKNLAWKAAELFRKATGIREGISITLHKNIPSPGGLGGGSSDTAAVLGALARLTGYEGNLMEMGGELGSDVPFFLAGHTSALVTGRGEEVRECKVPFYHAVLVDSMENIPTPTAYRLWDERGGHLTGAGPVNHYTALNFGVWHEGKPFPVELGNHFLPILSERFKGVKRAAADLSGLSDSWGLSGSGPVLYALFRTEDEAGRAQEKLRGKYPWVLRCRSRQIGASSNG